MATVTVYPPYRAWVGRDTFDLDLSGATPVRRVLELIGERYPGFRELARAPSNEFLWSQLIVHVNDEIVGLEDPVHPTDHLDLLPPISGGRG